MDELSAFKFAPPELKEAEAALLKAAHVVFTGGQSLYEAKRGKHPNVHAFPSSVDARHFAKARQRGIAEPREYADIPRPRFGFFGVIDERLDIDLVAQMADLRPDWSFVMIGPVVKIDPQALPQRANIHWLGGRDYKDLPEHLAHWDVGIMPFALNESTRYISPTKTPEFLAAGLPVVSSAITDVVRPYGELGLVEIARSPEDFVRRCEGLLTRPPKEWLADVDDYLSGLSWDRTWNGMLGAMREAMPRRKSKARGTVASIGAPKGSSDVRV
jgi:glycosyltransferase involved in cell wall biosynthesis